MQKEIENSEVIKVYHTVTYTKRGISPFERLLLGVQQVEFLGYYDGVDWDGDGHLVVATTRPETMLGDSAVAVHPDDDRYSDLIGQEVVLPIVGRHIPIIADDYVDPEFGTGLVKITPAHDFNDYLVGQRHGFEPINVLTLDAKMNDNAPEAYRGLDRFEARKRILADLQQQGLLVSEKPHKLKVPRSGRTGVIVEPMLTDQWFVDADDQFIVAKSIVDRRAQNKQTVVSIFRNKQLDGSI